MKSAPRTVGLLLLVVLAGCSNGKIPLAYNFEEGDGTRYRWTIDSRTSVNSSSERSVTTTNMVVDVHEQVSGDDEPVLTITLKPTSLSQGGAAMQTPPATTVKYQLNERGEILNAVTDDLEGPAASAVQLGATLIRSRIALPAGPVGIGDEWDAPLVLDGDLGNIQLDGHGKLLGFELKGKRKLARIETSRTGEIVTHQQQGGVPVRLRGSSTTNAMSSLDVDNGVLYSSSAQLISDFDIASQESGKLIGTMRVTLDSKLELAPQPA
ncbi:MAG: hypothetical protein WD178_02080 [Actinomycetota bacterium]